jgi:hypothetical protein
MANTLDPKEFASFRELLMANEIYMEALVQLLVEKGILTQQELLTRIKRVQAEMAGRPKH